MSHQTEIEKRYLVKALPELIGLKSKETIDVYFPEFTDHATLRARGQGGKYELTKKVRAKQENQYVMTEQTIDITKEEFEFFYSVSSRRIEKVRYFFPDKDNVIEIDVFAGKHLGLVIAEVEFEDLEKAQNFIGPDWLGEEINDVTNLAGGVLSGLSFSELNL